MDRPDEQESPPEAQRMRLRWLLPTILLLAPLLLAESWSRRQLELVYPYMTHPLSWVEAKLLLIDRAGCPEVVTFGSSITNQDLPPRSWEEQRIPFDSGIAPAESVFSFGLQGARGTMMYAAWRQIRRGGCVPEYVVVEVTPTVVNSLGAWAGYYRPLIDLPTLWKLPAGFAREAKLDPPTLMRLLTWDRLHLYRLRTTFRKALVERAGLRPFSGKAEALKLDGAMHELFEDAQSWVERGSGAAPKPSGPWFELSESSVGALAQLAVEAQQAGSRAVLHTPPFARQHRDRVARVTDFEAVRWDVEQRLQGLGVRPESIPWRWCYNADSFRREEFKDSIHLNAAGARHYVRGLAAWLRAGNARADGCEVGSG